MRAIKDWFRVRIAEWRLDKIKYIAFYQTASKSGIEYCARLKCKPIIWDKKYKKYKFVFNESPKSLGFTILKSNPKHNFRSSRYTKFEKLNSDANLEDLF